MGGGTSGIRHWTCDQILDIFVESSLSGGCSHLMSWTPQLCTACLGNPFVTLLCHSFARPDVPDVRFEMGQVICANNLFKQLIQTTFSFVDLQTLNPKP